MGPLSSYDHTNWGRKFSIGSYVMNIDPSDNISPFVKKEDVAIEQSARIRDLQQQLSAERTMVKMLMIRLRGTGRSEVATTDMIEALREILDKTT